MNPFNSKQPAKDIEATVTIGTVFVSFEFNGCVKVKGDVTETELAAIATISEVLRRLRLGKFFDYDIDPLNLMDSNQLVACEWLRSGVLKLKVDKFQKPVVPSRKYDHAANVDEAMERRRNFTCSAAVYQMLPKRRLINQKRIPLEPQKPAMPWEVVESGKLPATPPAPPAAEGMVD